MKHISPIRCLLCFGILSTLFATLNLTFGIFEHLPTRHKGKTALRLVVFGDSWCDNEFYAPERTLTESRPSRDLRASRVWTEVLCDAIECDHENYARSIPYSFGPSGYSGVPVDNRMYNQSTPDPVTTNSIVADLRTQIMDWARANGLFGRRFSAKRSWKREVKTLFVVGFGLWDTWNAAKSLEETTYLVTNGVDVIFQALDHIVDNKIDASESKVRVVIPMAVDITFFPGYSKDSFRQRHAKFLVETWNRLLIERTENWLRGSIFLFDTNNLVVDRIRSWQMQRAGTSDSNGVGKEGSEFENVDSSCVGTGIYQTNSDEHRCSDPWSYLFWDDVHLGPSAHKMIAAEILESLKQSPYSWL